MGVVVFSIASVVHNRFFKTIKSTVGLIEHICLTVMFNYNITTMLQLSARFYTINKLDLKGHMENKNLLLLIDIFISDNP